jgi:nucleotide-binding universal stress UspA family protein
MYPGAVFGTMTVLVPIDTSENSFRALEFAAEFAERFDTDLHTMHVTDLETGTTDDLIDRIRETLAETPFEDDPEVITDKRRFRANDEVGNVVLDQIDEHEYEHVVMGHHGTGIVGRAILGSATETVLDEIDVPLTIIP